MTATMTNGRNAVRIADKVNVPFKYREIRRRRDDLGRTLKECAEAGKLKGGVQQWSDLERGRYLNPRLDTLESLARGLGCNVVDLLTKPARK